MTFTNSAGVWVDGFPATQDHAGRMLRNWLASANFVTIVVTDGFAEPHTVSLTEALAQDLASLVGASPRDDHDHDKDADGGEGHAVRETE